MSNKNAHAKILSRKTVFEGFHKLEIVELQPRSLRHEEWCQPYTREVYHCRPVSIVLLYIPETDEILLQEQFRPAPLIQGAENSFVLECAAGGIDDGETPEECARREALEETGCAIREIEFITHMYPSPGATTEEFYIYCGRIEKPATGVFGLDHEEEEIKTHLFSTATVFKMLEEGKIKNGTAVLALYWFQFNRDKIRKKWMGI